MPIEALIGQVIGDRYIVEEKIGQGGFGAVYRATHRELGRDTALKFVPGNAPPEVIARLRREARLLAGIRHPAVVTVHDFGVTGGRFWLAQEFIPGQSLAETMADAEPMPMERATAIALGALAGLEVAHRAGIVHRDVKPGNLMLTPGPAGEEVRVLDFGIARVLTSQGETQLTRDGSILGTPLYIAPEQARGDDIGPPADLYALGAVLYHMLAGEPPFRTSDPLSTVIRHIQDPVPPLPDAIPAGLARVVYRALEKHPDDRFPDAAAMAEALRQAVEQQPPEARSPDRGRSASWAVWVAATGLLCIGAFGAWRCDGAPQPDAVWQRASASVGPHGPPPEAAPPAVERIHDAWATPSHPAPPDAGRADLELPDVGLPDMAPEAPSEASPPTADSGARAGRLTPSKPSPKRRFSAAVVERDLALCRCVRARKRLSRGHAIATQLPVSTRRDIERLSSEHRIRCLLVSGPCFGTEK